MSRSLRTTVFALIASSPSSARGRTAGTVTSQSPTNSRSGPSRSTRTADLLKGSDRSTHVRALDDLLLALFLLPAIVLSLRLSCPAQLCLAARSRVGLSKRCRGPVGPSSPARGFLASGGSVRTGDQLVDDARAGGTPPERQGPVSGDVLAQGERVREVGSEMRHGLVLGPGRGSSHTARRK